jgi:hypothetical protein
MASPPSTAQANRRLRPDDERYRELFGVDADFVAADRIRDESGCVLRYERTFMRPVLEGQLPDR